MEIRGEFNDDWYGERELEEALALVQSLQFARGGGSEYDAVLAHVEAVRRQHGISSLSGDEEIGGTAPTPPPLFSEDEDEDPRQPQPKVML